MRVGRDGRRGMTAGVEAGRCRSWLSDSCAFVMSCVIMGLEIRGLVSLRLDRARKHYAYDDNWVVVYMLSGYIHVLEAHSMSNRTYMRHLIPSHSLQRQPCQKSAFLARQLFRCLSTSSPC
jgi:hypothetical protein